MSAVSDIRALVDSGTPVPWLQMRHERGDHEHCPSTWCEVAAIYQQADDQCRRPRESGISPPGSDGGVS